nr:LysE family translocator [uncultured Roseobacter sp.]
MHWNGAKGLIDWTGLAAVFAAFFVVAASPEPATLALGAVSAASGRKCGMIFGADLSVGLSFWGLIAATGLGAVLQASTHLLAVLKIAGGDYLLWLAYGSAFSAIRTTSGKTAFNETAPLSAKGLFTRGLILNLSNPKAVVAWMAALSVGLGGEDALLSLMIGTLGCALVDLPAPFGPNSPRADPGVTSRFTFKTAFT